MKDIIFGQRNGMKFPWFEPSARKAVKILFEEFTPEERKILDADNCVIPNMYSRILEKSVAIKTFKYPLKEAKREMQIFFFRPGKKRVDVSDPEIQSGIYQFFSDVLNWGR